MTDSVRVSVNLVVFQLPYLSFHFVYDIADSSFRSTSVVVIIVSEDIVVNRSIQND